MYNATQLLDRAYILLAEERVAEAAKVLDMLLQDDPHNIEAWELYMQISDSHAALESLAERVHWNRELSPGEKDEILAYQEYMLSRQESDPVPDEPDRQVSSSRSALAIVAIIFVLLLTLWAAVPDVRTMTPFYFLIAFVIGLGLWFWRSEQAAPFGVRSYSYGVSSPRFGEPEKPEFFYHEPIIKVGPAPEDGED